MLELLASPEAWLAFFTLTVLELVLGIDNVIFIAILVDKLPSAQRERARKLGLTVAMLMRVGLLFAITWIVGATAPLFTIIGNAISGRDLILIGGGLFLLFKSTKEMHQLLEGEEGHQSKSVKAAFNAVLLQIVIIDIVFSFDSIITAVGMAKDVAVMVAAVIASVGLMMGDLRVRLEAPDDQDAGALVPLRHRHDAHRRRLRLPCAEGVHLLRDGVLGGRGDAEYPAAEEGPAGGPARAVRAGGRKDEGRRMTSPFIPRPSSLS
jgi:hypothetical protein